MKKIKIHILTVTLMLSLLILSLLGNVLSFQIINELRGRITCKTNNKKATTAIKSVAPIAVQTLSEGLDIIAMCTEQLDLYGELAVSDLLSIVGLTPSYLDSLYFWKTIDEFSIIPAVNVYGIRTYTLVVPPASTEGV